MNEYIKTVAEQYGSIGRKIDGNTQLLNRTAEDISVIKMDIGLIKNSLKKKVDLEEFEALEKRVNLLESRT